MRTEKILMKDATGRISADTKSPCPPGCIILDIGEEIQARHLKYFEEDVEINVLIVNNN